MDIGCRIKELRKRDGLNQSELAKIINLTASAMSLIEAGKNNPTPEAIVKLCQYFGVSTDYLLTGNEEPIGISQDEKEVIEIMREDTAFKKAVTEAASFKKKAINYLVSYQQQHTQAA
jgi:transcriptional regulator with XRE-family HTH domain